MLAGHSALRGSAASLGALDPTLGEPIAPTSDGATAADADRACHLADNTCDSHSRTDSEPMAPVRGAIAANLLALGEEFVERTMSETGLPKTSVQDEQARTAAQLRHFALVGARALESQAPIMHTLNISSEAALSY